MPTEIAAAAPLPVYRNEGNAFAAQHMPLYCRHILDVGCGCGDTARLLKARLYDARIEGVTHNPVEAEAAAATLERIHVFDIEGEFPPTLPTDFDGLLFSHVLEHMRDPVAVVRAFIRYLKPGGAIVIAVPNVLEWRTRLRLLRGEWNYATSGILDRTHLTFVTFKTAEREILGEELGRSVALDRKIGQGTVPLGPFRRLPFASRTAEWLDRWGARNAPNLFAQQIVLVARKL